MNASTGGVGIQPERRQNDEELLSLSCSFKGGRSRGVESVGKFVDFVEAYFHLQDAPKVVQYLLRCFLLRL